MPKLFDMRSCNICGGGNFELLYEGQQFHPLWFELEEGAGALPVRYEICTRCGYVVLHNRLSQQQLDHYYATVPTVSSPLSTIRQPMLLDRKAFLEKHLKLSGIDSVLEVGASHGDFLAMLDDISTRRAIEPSVSCCTHMQETIEGIDVTASSLQSALAERPDLRGANNLVMACNVLEHVVDPKAFVSALLELAAPNGHVYIEVPSLEAMAECSEPVYQTLHVGHISQFSVPVMERLCCVLGMKIVAVETSNEHNYPVLRLLAEKRSPREIAGTAFARHLQALTQRALKAKRKLFEVMDESDDVVIWGVGQDLFDLASIFDDSELARYENECRIVDINHSKVGRMFFGKTVEDAGQLSREECRTICIPCRSDIIKSSIEHSVLTKNPDSRVVMLY